MTSDEWGTVHRRDAETQRAAETKGGGTGMVVTDGG